MEEEKIKILIVDASEVWQKNLAGHIASASDMTVVGKISNSQSSIFLLEEIDPDVVMLEASAKDRIPAAEIIKQLKEIKPDVRVIVCTEKSYVPQTIPAMESGAYDVIIKPYHRHEMLRLIRQSMA